MARNASTEAKESEPLLTSARPKETAQRRAAAAEQSHDRQASLNANRIVDGGAGSNLAVSMNSRPEVTRLGSLQRAANNGPGATRVAQMKATLEGGSSGVAQMNGWNDWFKRHIYGPHDYTVRHKAYEADPFEETHEEATQKVFEGMKGHPAPLSFGRESTEEGRTMWIPPFGQIFTKTNPQDNSLTNETVPWKHFLHPGKVKRTAIGQDIETRGTGTGMLPSTNEFMSNLLWGGVANTTRLQIDPKYAMKHYAELEKQMDKLKDPFSG